MSVPAMAAVYISPPGAIYAPPEHDAGSSRGQAPCAAAAASPSAATSHRNAGAVLPLLVPVRGAIHEGPDTIEELLDRHLVKKPAAVLDDDTAEAEARRRLTSSRREALGLYRDILRATRLFAWPDDRGVPWREVLRANARREFEEARGERNPEVVARLLIGGRDAVQQERGER